MSAIELLYKNVVRPWLFKMSEKDPEIAHEFAVRQLLRMQDNVFLTALAKKLLIYRNPILESDVFGLHFPNPLGLAAGFDKYCKLYWRAIPAMGWGFCEVGGITQHSQQGNPRPRMWRSEKYSALCNFMGFNNPGSVVAGLTMAQYGKSSIPTGVNVGKSKDTNLRDAGKDYYLTIRQTWENADFFTLNPSSPNTPRLRELQQPGNLAELIDAAQEGNRESAKFHEAAPKPMGVKLSPDMTDSELSDAVTVCQKKAIDFLILVNTTLNRKGLNGWDIPKNHGGVSGPPLAVRAWEVLVAVSKIVKGTIPLISVGGIFGGRDVYNRILWGASLCEILTGFPFEGPDVAKRSLITLVDCLTRDGYKNVSEAVGAKL